MDNDRASSKSETTELGALLGNASYFGEQAKLETTSNRVLVFGQYTRPAVDYSPTPLVLHRYLHRDSGQEPHGKALIELSAAALILVVQTKDPTRRKQ